MRTPFQDASSLGGVGGAVQYVRGFTAPAQWRGPRWHEGSKHQHAQSHPATAIAREIARVGWPWDGWVLVFDCETTTDARQALRVGFYELHGISHARRMRDAQTGTVTRERLDAFAHAGGFYNPAELSADEQATFQAYCAARGIACVTVQAFVHEVFYRWVYRYGALVVGANLPFDLSRLATDVRRGRGAYRNGFSFTLCECRYRQCFKHPAVRVKHLGKHKHFIRFQHANRVPRATDGALETMRYYDPEKADGRFLDVMTLAHALLGPGDMSLAGLARALQTRQQKLDTDEHGAALTREYLDYARHDVSVTWQVYQQLRDLYARHGLKQTPMWRIYSEASIGKAYLREMGIAPLLVRHPDFPREILGHAMTAMYGARVEVRERLRPRQVTYLDFKSQYPTVNALLGLQDLLLARELQVRRGPHVVADVGRLLESLTLDALIDPALWRMLRIFCLVRPQGDRLPLRARYGGVGRTGDDHRWEIGEMNVALPLIEHGQPTWYALPDVLASVLLTGKVPQILDAFEIVPTGGPIDVTPLAFFGDVEHTLDPARGDFFIEVINLRNAVKVQAKAERAAGDAVEATRLDALELAVKLLANGTAYGIYVEVDEQDSDECRAQPITVHALSSWQTSTKHPETPGAYCFPPIGALITAGGRLLLAMAECFARREGLDYAHLDTDGITLARPDDVAPTDFDAACRRVSDAFTSLSPYRGKLPILEVEAENLWDGQATPLYFLGVSSKRYVLYNLVPDLTSPIERDGRRYQVRIRKFSGHGLGSYHLRDGYVSPAHIPPPCVDDVRRLGGDRWIYDLWHDFVVAIESGNAPSSGQPLRRNAEGAPLYTPPVSLLASRSASEAGGVGRGLAAQTVCHQVTLSTWQLFEQYSAHYRGHLFGVRPFSFFCVMPPLPVSIALPGSLPARAAQAAGRRGRLWRDREAWYQAHARDNPHRAPFIGPYVGNSAELQTAIAAGLFGWYTTDEARGETTFHPLWVGVEPLTLAEAVSGYFRHPETKSGAPRGVGALPVCRVSHIAHVEVVGKETDSALLDLAEESGDVLTQGAAWPSGAQVFGVEMGGTEGLTQRLKVASLADLMLASGLSRMELANLRAGRVRQPTRETLAALSAGLWLLSPENPAGIAGWRDIPNAELAAALNDGAEDIWTAESVKLVRTGTRRLDSEERQRIVAAIRTLLSPESTIEGNAALRGQKGLLVARTKFKGQLPTSRDGAWSDTLHTARARSA